jgi:CubicO group peptidase (beta-lactamase class C family)
MDRRTATINVLLAFALAGAGSLTWADSAPTGAPTLPASTAATLSRQLVDAVGRGDTPGVVALVVNRDGVLYEGAAGKRDTANNVPMSVDTIFNIASMTKPVTSVAIMMLLEQGKLRLDDPVSKFLPGFDNLKVITKFNEANGTYETRPAKRAMTIRHLLTHTSGIAYAFSNPMMNKMQPGTQKMEWEFPLVHDPGDKWTYGASTRVLGLIVEKLTGTPLENYYQEHIFKPLGMVDTSYGVTTAKQVRLSTSYRVVDGKRQEQPKPTLPDTPAPPYRGDGGLYSTAHDYGLFMRMLLNGGKLGNVRIISERTVKLMGENHIGAVFVSQQPAANPALTKPFPLGAGQDKFGLGFQIAAKVDGAAQYRSPGSMSWAGLFNTEFWVDPQKGIGGVMLMQFLPFYDGGAISTLREFEATVYRDLK